MTFHDFFSPGFRDHQHIRPRRHVCQEKDLQVGPCVYHGIGSVRHSVLLQHPPARHRDFLWNGL